MAREKSYKVPKQRLDPFGAREQAISLVRREANPPRGRNDRALEYDAIERGDHYEVKIRAKKAKAGQINDRARGPPEHSQGQGPPEEPPGLNVEGSGPLGIPGAGAGPDATPELASALNAHYSRADLHRAARRHGVTVRGRGKRGVIEGIIRQRPLLAQRLAGR